MSTPTLQGAIEGRTSPLTGWPVLLILAAGLALLALVWHWASAPLAPGADAPSAPASRRVLTDAQFQSLDADDARLGPVSVTLPDTWSLRDDKPRGAGRYRLRFSLRGAPPQPWALALARVSSSRTVWLNGTLIEGADPLGRGRPEHGVIELPAALLRDGVNHIDLEVRHHVRGGLSTAELGEAALLRAEAQRAAVFERELPRALNIGMAVVATLMLLVRWRRPGETTIALFGALALLGSLRNITYFAKVSPLPVGLADWLFYAMQVWTALLFLGFARSLGEAPARPRLDRLPPLIAIALPLAAAVLQPLGHIDALRMVTYPVLLVSAVLAVVLIARNGRRRSVPAIGVLVAVFGATIVAAAHDYLFQQGHLPIVGRLWMPYVMPVALGLYALVLLSRFVRAIGELEALRDTLEQQVAQRTLALEGAVAAKSRFLAAASHDLRQPAVALGLMIGMVREHPLAPEVRPMIEHAHQAVGALEGLLKGLLDLSRLDSGVLQPQPVPVSLQALFQAIESHEREAAAAKGLSLRFVARDLAVHCDAQLLDQLLRNLVANALRYTERGGVLVTARARAPNRVLIQVWDTGVGIAPQHQADVFEEFVQMPNAARGSEHGLGLGLAIVKRCAALLGTEVRLRSRLGHGSSFGVRLPRFARRVESAPAAPLPTPHPLNGRRVLLVEDDASVREALTARHHGWGALGDAFDGVQAVRAWRPRRGEGPDLLLTDHQLADGDGLQLIDEQRLRFGAALPALVITGNTAPEAIAGLAKAGAAVLHKPFLAEALLTAIDHCIAGATPA